jgi:hypothetical protein
MLVAHWLEVKLATIAPQATKSATAAEPDDDCYCPDYYYRG